MQKICAHIVVGICGKICDMRIWPKYADPKSVRRIVGIGTVGIGSVGIGTCTRFVKQSEQGCQKS